jgi:hypothetical protein
MQALGQRTAHGRARSEFFAHHRDGRIARHQRAAQANDLRLQPLDPRGLFGQQARAALLHPGIRPQQHGMFLHRELHAAILDESNSQLEGHGVSAAKTPCSV